MELSILAKTFDRIERITSRTQLTLALVELFRKTPKELIDKVIYLLQGKLWPDWKGMPELGVGEKLLIKAIAKAVRARESEVESLYKKFGDLGKAAEFLKQRQTASAGVGLTKFLVAPAKQVRLTVERVYTMLTKVALATGEGSRDIKINLIAGLIADATPLEARYLVRFIEGRLRLGIGDATIMDALAIVFAGSQAYRPIIERAYNIRADLGNIARILATHGIKALEGIKPEVGIPIRPMLAERLSNPHEILSKVGGKALVEYKYDGERAQIHKKGDNVWIYSRRLENITHQYPDVVEMVLNNVRSNEAIIEGEIVAIDPDTGEMKPFQELMHRKRKHDIHEAIREYPVAVFLFDILYNDGIDLTTKPITERREILRKVINETENFRIAEHMVTDSPEELEKFFLKAIEDGAEGVMVKAMHRQAIYQAGARGWLWIKYKRDYKSEMTDTVDLVVVGAFAGRGRRAGRYGALLVAAYDPERDMFRTVCKVGSGFTDEDLMRLNEILRPYIIPHKHPRVDSIMKPDVWVTPAIVIEIIGAELTLSPIHTCCKDMVKKGAGISIRFPRFIRFRDDKKPEDASTIHELLEMYKRQLRRIEEAATTPRTT
ncbi:MAG TPA: ATP-dependent DNA ligase [Acidilobales archaeon]|nr:ATP-dependent DNA ligase [Acidilobales archaeon]